MRYREFFNKMHTKNDGTRLITESILIPEVEYAFNDWIKNTKDIDYAVIGGIALSFYTRPRATTDVDALFIDKTGIPQYVNHFKKHRNGAFQHNDTHVEIEILTPQTINVPDDLVIAIIKNAKNINGIKVATPSGLIASKLGRFKLQDQADIEALLEYGDIDLSPYPIPHEWLIKLDNLKKQLGIN
jgi:hypothetical protein